MAVKPFKTKNKHPALSTGKCGFDGLIWPFELICHVSKHGHFHSRLEIKNDLLFDELENLLELRFFATVLDIVDCVNRSNYLIEQFGQIIRISGLWQKSL